MRTDRRLAASLAGLAAAAVLAACSSGSGSQPSGSASAAGSHNGTLTIAESTDPVSFNPLQQRVTSTFSVLRNLYDPLVDFANGGSDFTSFTPVLATSWKQLSPTAYRFTLRRGVRFDDGQPFDSASVVYTVQALLGQLPHSQPSLAAFLFPSLTRAAASGPYAVTLYTKTPTPDFLAALTQLLIVPSGSSTGPSGALASHPDGTGAYRLTSYTPDQSLVMTANAGYFLGPPKIRKLVWETIASPSAQLAALLSGSVNVAFGLDPSQVATVRASGTARVVTVPSTRVAALWLNTLSVAPLEKRLVRQALNYAVDKQALVSSTLGGLGQVTATIVPSYFTGYNPAVAPYPYDPAKAKALLSQAGYPHGFPLTIMVPSSHYILGPQVVQVIASELQQVGIAAKIDEVSFSSFATLTAKRQIPAAFYGAWGSSYPDPLQMFQTIVLGGTTGFSWYNNPAVNALINQASVAASSQAYTADLAKIQDEISTDPPFVYLFAYADAWGISKGLNWTPLSTEVEDFYGASW
ncbi:MAG TPA: ABC transporter substrate-binding protein [Streptosporangiaceae bacterium]|jgi:peptide/nickel transport system substrate-binding protein|nr:ABC transporter substrate-binding protein [Streptosporangiaceae bacterium]